MEYKSILLSCFSEEAKSIELRKKERIGIAFVSCSVFIDFFAQYFKNASYQVWNVRKCSDRN